MLDKNLVKSKFFKSLATYDNNALVQAKMAEKLVSLIKKKDFENIIEIGSYTGLLTKNIIRNFNFSSYLALDIIDSFDCIKNLSPKIRFLKKDIEDFIPKEKFDLIISNASLQWCNDFEKTVSKLKSMSKTNSLIAFSIFDKDNLFEIKDVFKIGLDYKSKEELKEIFLDSGFRNFKIFSEHQVLKFASPKEVLKHLKLTGVNSLSQKKMSYREIKEKLDLLDKKYGNKITYSILYIILS